LEGQQDLRPIVFLWKISYKTDGPNSSTKLDFPETQVPVNPKRGTALFHFLSPKVVFFKNRHGLFSANEINRANGVDIFLFFKGFLTEVFLGRVKAGVSNRFGCTQIVNHSLVNHCSYHHLENLNSFSNTRSPLRAFYFLQAE